MTRIKPKSRTPDAISRGKWTGVAHPGKRPASCSDSGAAVGRVGIIGWCFLYLALIARAEAAGPVIIFIGPPGAGKTTQTRLLQKERGFALVSADDLIDQNREAFQKFRQPAIRGVEPHADPALNRLVEEKLRSLDLSKGLILDGYPASKEQGDYLVELKQKLNLPKPVVIQLEVPDAVVRKRLAQENREDVEQRLKDYHREFDFARLYFPQADIHTIDGTKSEATVAKAIQKVLP
jgi:adenylate kinase